MDEHTDSEITQDLQNLIEKLGYRNSMNVEDVVNYPEENDVTQLLTDEEIIENVMGTDKDVVEDDESSGIEPPSRNNAIKEVVLSVLCAAIKKCVKIWHLESKIVARYLKLESEA